MSKPVTDFYRYRKADATAPVKDESEWLRNNAAKSDWLATRMERFRQLCLRLNMDELTMARATDILNRRHQRLPSSAFTPEFDGDATWGICALWVAGRVQAYPEGANSRSQTFNGVTLNQLLAANEAKRTVPEFLEDLKRFLDDPSLEAIAKEKRDLLAPDVERLRQSHSRLQLVFNRFSETFPLLFPASVNESVLRDVARFAWYLFLIAKESLLDPKSSSNFNEFILCQCALLFAYQMSERDTVRPLPELLRELAAAHSSVDTLGADQQTALRMLLCARNRVEYSMFRDAERSQFLPFVQQLLGPDQHMNRLTRWLRFEYQATPEPPIQLSLVSHLLDSSLVNLRSNVQVLSERYELFLRNTSGELDGRAFVADQSAAATPRKSSSWRSPTPARSPATRNLQHAFDEASYVGTPLSSRPLVEAGSVDRNGEIALVRQSLEYMSSLCAPEPSAYLTELLQEAAPGHILLCQHQLEHAFLLVPRELRQSNPQYARYVGMLYYRTLEMICRKEEARLIGNREQVLQLLRNIRFHRSLLAACLEVVDLALTSPHRKVDFGATLHHFGLTPFDFVIVLDSFVRVNVTQLSRGAIKRLKELEERILECEAWKDEEPVYTLLGAEVAAQSPRKALTAISSPVRRSMPLVGGAGTAQAPGRVTFFDDRQWRSNQLQLFCRKVLLIAHLRLAKLCQDLPSLGPHITLEPEVEQRTWDFFVSFLEEEFTRRLLYQRHLDQILLCTLYAVAKMSKSPILFRDIIAVYKRQPQFKSHVVFNVNLRPNTVVDIIRFYNEGFLPLVDSRMTPTAQVPRSPRPVVQTLVAGSPVRPGMLAQQNVSLSPLQPDRALGFAPSPAGAMLPPPAPAAPGAAPPLPVQVLALRGAPKPPLARSPGTPSRALGGASVSGAYTFGEYSGEGVSEGLPMYNPDSKRRLDFDDDVSQRSVRRRSSTVGTVGGLEHARAASDDDDDESRASGSSRTPTPESSQEHD